MYRRWRAVKDSFGTNEQLYRRFRRTDLVNGELVPSALKFPKKGEATGQSVNRSAFSKPEDALWDEEKRYDGWGVFQFPVACLPSELTCPDTGRRFTFFPKHVPVRKNYAHSEIWCDRLPRAHAGYVVPTSLVKLELRALISQNIQVVLTAQR